MGAVMTYRLGRFHVNPLLVWVVPALAGLAVTAYLSWGAWVTAHDPRWLTLSQVWWRADLAPARDMTLLVAVLVWLGGLGARSGGRGGCRAAWSA